MNCELAHEHIVAAAYGELPDDQVHQLERHVIACPECQKEREQILALRVLADAHLVVTEDAHAAQAHVDGLTLSREKFHTGRTAVQRRPDATVLPAVLRRRLRGHGWQR